MADARTRLPRVLHVEDDDDIRAITEIALSVVGGLEIRQCSSGAEALAVAEAFDPQIFLLDVMMPDMTGEETLRRLRDLPGHAETPVIFMTAKARAGDLDRLMALGSERVISKPFDPLTLATQIIEVWEERDKPASR